MGRRFPIEPFARAALCCALLAVPFPAAAAGFGGPYFIADRSFHGAVSFEMAQRAAAAAAGQAAMQSLARDLVARPDVRFAGGAGGSPIPKDPLALAYASARIETQHSRLRERGPRRGVVVRLSLTAPDDATLRRALLQTARLDLYVRAAAREAALLAAYDEAAAPLLEAGNDEAAGPSGEGPGQEEAAARAAALSDALLGMELYLEALSGFSGVWDNPDETGRLMLRILALDPDNPLALNAHGECCLLLGRLAEAQEAQRKAVELAPDFDRAFHARGAANLALSLPALAVADFSEAIRLSPYNASYREARAAAHLMREEAEAMCVDLRDACALGDCSGYRWALGRGRCPDAGDNPQPLSGRP